MAELSLTDVFGPGATQTANSITISKADLAGLIPAAVNATDAIAVGVINLLVANYTAARRAADKDISLEVIPQLPSLVPDFAATSDTTTTYLNKPVTVNIYSPFATTGLNPNDYENGNP